jgi:hypothetical protein
MSRDDYEPGVSGSEVAFMSRIPLLYFELPKKGGHLGFVFSMLVVLYLTYLSWWPRP